MVQAVFVVQNRSIPPKKILIIHWKSIISVKPFIHISSLNLHNNSETWVSYLFSNEESEPRRRWVICSWPLSHWCQDMSSGLRDCKACELFSIFSWVGWGTVMKVAEFKLDLQGIEFYKGNNKIRCDGKIQKLLRRKW